MPFFLPTGGQTLFSVLERRVFLGTLQRARTVDNRCNAVSQNGISILENLKRIRLNSIYDHNRRTVTSSNSYYSFIDNNNSTYSATNDGFACNVVSRYLSHSALTFHINTAPFASLRRSVPSLSTHLNCHLTKCFG